MKIKIKRYGIHIMPTIAKYEADGFFILGYNSLLTYMGYEDDWYKEYYLYKPK